MSRFVARDSWRRDRSEILYAFKTLPEGDEPDWFGVAYRQPIDPTASLEERMRQYNERVLPLFTAAEKKGEFRRAIGEATTHG